MKDGVVLFSKGVLYIIAVIAIAVCFVLLPELAREESVGKPDITVPFLAISYLLATPFFVALFQTHRLVQLIEKKEIFSQKSLKVLQNIKWCSIIFSLLVVVIAVVGITHLRTLAPEEDAPPFIMIGSVLTFVSLVISVFIAVLERLLTEAVKLKSENDSIV